MAAKSNSLSVPSPMQARYQEICALIDAVCNEKLNAEYALASKELAAKLARKRPSPLIGGRVNSWACGIVYTIGSVNFLFDKSQKPHLRSDELCALFGVAVSTGGNKAKQIRDIFKISHFSVEWILPSRLAESPIVWLISVNGLIEDARYLPREIQEEAYRLGLIPYIPGDDEP